MNNKVFYQHPNLMRVLGMHETVMEVMVNVLGAEKSQVMLPELSQDLSPGQEPGGDLFTATWLVSIDSVTLPRERERCAQWQEGARRRDCAAEGHAASVRASSLEARGLFWLIPLGCSAAVFIVLRSPAPSQMEFLWVPLRSLVCFVLCQEKAVLQENKILMILAVFPQECACFLCEPSS